MDECERSHAEIVERIAGAHGIRPETITPLRSMHTGETVGEVATLSAMNIDRAVGAELRIDDGESPVWIRSFHVFSGSFTLIPHFAIEWFGTGDEPTDRVTVLVDLLPRIDLAVNLGYVDEVYGPLQGAYDDVAEV
ncbi:MAG: hypothetical protein JST73_13555, partial [Actinobacteria bacterium]|nr:hypothetical protein [Actinomycetota bacterium]